MLGAFEGGVAATLPDATSQSLLAGMGPSGAPAPVLVAPSTADERNTTQLRIIPIACWRVDDVRFEFDSSFVRPQVRAELRRLAELVDAHTKAGHKPALSVFGHADPVGADDHNKKLSGRRAAAIYGLLTRNPKIWEDISAQRGAFTSPLESDRWGTKAIQIMLHSIGHPPGAADGVLGGQTRAAIRDFQGRHGLAADGDPGPQTRDRLFRAYMDDLFTFRDEAGNPVQAANGGPLQLDLTATDFLAQGADANGKGDYQGCSEFNPVLLFAQEEEQELARPEHKDRRNTENEPNRRVTVLLFRPGSRVSAATWPCPRAREGVAGCRKRFWSDADTRRRARLAGQRREFEQTRDTFACRFYDRLTGRSPCEGIAKTFRIRLYDGFARFIASAPFEATIGAGPPFTGRADERGLLTLRDVVVPATCSIRWGFPADEGQAPILMFTRNVFLTASGRSEADDDAQQTASKKLNNLGYDSADTTAAVLAFQLDYGHLTEPQLTPTGELDDATLEVLDRVYQRAGDDLRDSRA
jgi:peptidoglycan hydrolase-like protein with peptidoglycan-binding domain